MLSSTAETYGVINSAINAFDLSFARYVADIRTVATTSYFFILTHFADLLVVMFVMLMVILVLKNFGYHKDVIPFAICVLGAALSSELLKLLFQRERPSVAVYFEPTFSFPSTHAAIALALYGFIAFLVTKYIRSKVIAVTSAFILVILALFVGVSRLYLGVHYLSDVIGGFLIAILCLTFSIKLAKIMEKDADVSKSNLTDV